MDAVRVVLLTLLLAAIGFAQEGGVLRGRLVGEAVEDMQVSLWSARRVATDTVGPDGRFELPCPEGMDEGRLKLVVEGDVCSYQLFGRTARALAAGREVDLGDVPTGAPGTLTGRLLDQDGKQLLGFVTLRGGVHASQHMALIGEREARIDAASGEFRLSGLAPGPWRLCYLMDFDVLLGSSILVDPVFEGAFASVDLEAGAEAYVELQVREFPELAVTLDPAPLPDHLFQARGMLVSPTDGRSYARASVGGTVHATAGVDALLALRFTSEEVEPIDRLFPVGAGAVTVPVRPSSGVDLTVPGAATFRAQARWRERGGWSAPVAFGSFRALAEVRLTPGSWLLEVETPGFPIQRRALTVSRGVVEPLEVVPREGITLTVQVGGGPSDLPVHDLPVQVQLGPRSLPIGAASLRTDATGRALLEGFVPGPARVAVAFGPSLVRSVEVEGDTATITAPPAGWVELHLATPDHVDPRGLLARAAADRESSERAKSFPGLNQPNERPLDVDGVVRLGPLLAGRRHVQLELTGRPWESLEWIDVEAGQVTTVERDERTTFPAQIEVVLEGLEPRRRCNLELRRTADGLLLQRVSSLLGRAVFAGSPPGTYVVRCEATNAEWTYTDPVPIEVEPGRYAEHTVQVPLVTREVALVDAEGEPWRLRAFLYSTGDDHVHLETADGDGRWHPRIPTGTLRVWPVTRDEEDAVVLEWKAGDDPLTITLDP